jgi:hypothetical protein
MAVSIDYFRHELNADDLISACKSFPYLRCMSIGAHAAARFMRSLMAHNSNDEDPLYLPALCELHLHKLSVAQEAPPELPDEPLLEWSELKAFLRRRVKKRLASS